MLETVRRQNFPKKVLYFPAGTYRITATLKLERISHHEPLGMSITGEDPEKTIIKWDGAAGQNMFLYNPWYASMSRLTFDGGGKAKTAIQHGVAFSTANEFTDMIIKDVAFGIEAGMRDGIAETAILRCRFYRCSKAAISIQNFNSLDFYIWDCWFEDCGIGATNEFDAGNFHVYQCVFLRSTDADITIRHTGYFSFVGNVSIGSKAFFHARRAAVWKPTETWGSQATLQDNLILDPQEPTPIQIENNGPNMVVDNTIRAKGDALIVRNEPLAGEADLICIGNTWTAAKPLQMKGRLTDLDNKVLKADEIKDVKPEPVAFLPRPDRPIIEVAASADAAAIQAAIDQAAAMKGKRPVVHLPKANYTIGKTLVIPAGTDLQLVGDGPKDATQLANTGGANPLILAGAETNWVLVARDGTPAPGTTNNFGSIAADSDMKSLAPDGRIAFADNLANGASGVWFGLPGAVQPVALSGQPVPASLLGGGYVFGDYDGAEIEVNGQGEHAFVMSVYNTNYEDVVLAGPPGALRVVAESGQPAPGIPGSIFTNINGSLGVFGDVLIGSDGSVAFVASFSATGYDYGLWLAPPNGTPQLLARTGGQAPGTPSGVVFTPSFQYLPPFDEFYMNASNQIAFQASVSGPGVGSTNSSGIWLAEPDGTVSLIVRAGDTAAGQQLGSVSLGYSMYLPPTVAGPEDGRRTPFNRRGDVLFSSDQGLFLARNGILLNVTVAGGEILLSFPTLAGKNYRVDFKSSLSAPAWSVAVPSVTGTGGNVTVTNAIPAGAGGFYRVARTD